MGVGVKLSDIIGEVGEGKVKRFGRVRWWMRYGLFGMG